MFGKSDVPRMRLSYLHSIHLPARSEAPSSTLALLHQCHVAHLQTSNHRHAHNFLVLGRYKFGSDFKRSNPAASMVWLNAVATPLANLLVEDCRITTVTTRESLELPIHVNQGGEELGNMKLANSPEIWKRQE